MKVQVINALKKVSFLSRYSIICSEFCDYKNGKTPLLKTIKDILEQIDDNFKYIKVERVFLKTLKVSDELTIRILVKFSSGIFEIYLQFIQDEEWVLYDRLDFLGNLIYPEYKESLEDKCLPVSTNDGETEQILKKVISLIDEFIIEFKNEILKAEKTQY